MQSRKQQGNYLDTQFPRHTWLERTDSYKSVTELLESEEPLRFIIHRLLYWGYTREQVADILLRRLRVSTDETYHIMKVYHLRRHYNYETAG